MNYMLLGDRYELLEKVGEGGMAIVYKARDRKLNRFVAVKVLKDSFKENEEIIKKFQKEAQAIATLSDPNIVNVLDVGNQDEMNYIVMEFIEGKTLKKIIQERGHLPNDVAIRIAIKVASALGCAHKNNIVHRDIKPHNILVTGEGVVKVTDFGIAKSMDSSTLAHTNTIMGSAHYFSPEQAKGGYIDFRTDIYSLGIVIYEMVTGKVPFDGDSAVTVALKHIQENVIPPKELNQEIPDSLNKLILKCMAKNPDERYESVVEVKVDLERVKDNPNTMIEDENGVEDESDYTRVMSPVSIDDTIYQNTPLYSEHDNHDEEYDEDEYDEDEYDEDEYDEFEDEQPRKKKGKNIGVGIIIAIAAIIVICGGIYAGISLGGKKIAAQKIQIPSVINQTVNAAQTTLKNEGFVVEVSQIENEAASGTVIKTNPVAGAEVAKGSTITIFVSTGPAPIAVQDVTTMNPSVAKQALQDAGLVPGEVIYNYSDSIPKGQVMGTNPAAGTKVTKGTNVNIIVSKGPEIKMVNVPSLSGMSVEAAKQALSQQGLTINAVSGNAASSAADNGKIYSQDPTAGYSVASGSTVNVTYYSDYVAPTPTPTPTPAPTPNPTPNPGGDENKDNGNTNGSTGGVTNPNDSNSVDPGNSTDKTNHNGTNPASEKNDSGAVHPQGGGNAKGENGTITTTKKVTTTKNVSSN